MRLFFALLPSLLLLAGCQQKMADQPAPRPYSESAHFANRQSARPLELGVVHRGQRPESDAMITGLSTSGRKSKGGDWSNSRGYDPIAVITPTGAPDSVENFAKDYPFEMTEADLHRGQQRYNVFCAVCHGAAGDGKGKIAERGYLRPPSYHRDPLGQAKDWSTAPSVNPPQPNAAALDQGYSRGFFRFYNKDETDAAKLAEQAKAHKIPLDEVPVGYIFQVITWGYGGMPDHASQIPPEDRWRIIAYVRALQLSQGADANKLPPDLQKKLEAKPGSH